MLLIRRTPTPALPLCQWRLRAAKPLDAAYPTELRTIGEHLRKRRLDMGLTQQGVSLLLGVDATTVANWESGRTYPDRRARVTVRGFLGPDSTNDVMFFSKKT